MKKIIIFPLLLLVFLLTGTTNTYAQTPCDGGFLGTGLIVMENTDSANGKSQIFISPYFGASTSGVTLFEWDFGDGSTESYNYFVQVMHSYDTSGTYTACLRFIDTIYGCDTTFCATFNVTVSNCGINSLNIGINNYIFYDSLNIDTTLGAPLSAGNVLKVNGFGIGNYSYDWQIDTNLYIQTGNIITHNFPTQQATSNICVYVNDNSGCSDTLCLANFSTGYGDTAYSVLFYEDTLQSNVDSIFLNLVVEPALNLYDTVVQNQVMANYPYSLYDMCIPISSLDSVYDVFWVFDDSIIQLPYPIYTFTQLGSHSICVYLDFVQNGIKYYSSICYDFEITLKSNNYSVVINSGESVPLNINNLDILENIKVFPNPARNIINLTGLKENSSTIIKIISSSGQLIREEIIQNNTSLNIASLENGFYFLVVQQEGKKAVLKIIKE